MEGLIETEEFNFWLTIKLQERLYAIDCKYVDSIFEITEDIKPIPMSQEAVTGIISVRGKVLPVVDLRRLFNIKTVEQEKIEFENMLNTRKQEHISWVEALKNCLANGTEFSLAANPHECAFGKWYDKYKPNNQMLQMYFNRIKAPHTMLHHSAIHCFSEHDDSAIQNILEKETDKSMELVINTLEQMIDAYKKSFRQMCIAVSDGVTDLGLLVDEIVNAEILTSAKK